MVNRAALGIGSLRNRRVPRSAHRIALSPACWGISDIPNWGHQLDPDRVLSEAAAIGEGAVTAGPPGFLPDRSDLARNLLRGHRVRVVAGEVHAILHHHDLRGPELAHIDGHAHWLAAIGAETLVLTAIPERSQDARRPGSLSSAEWAHLLHLIGSVEHVCARHRLRLAVEPRFGSTIEGPAEIERLLVGSEAGLCVDVAQLVIAGADPVEVVELAGGRIRQVKLNDVDPDIAVRVRDRTLDFADAVTRNLYRPAGEGGADVARVIEALRESNYRGWYTLEQETRLPSHDVRPLGGISRSLEYVLPLLS